MTGLFFFPANLYKAPVVGPPERWRFHEPANRGQRWHMTRADFYSQDTVHGGETKSVCDAYGELKPDGVVIAVASIDEDDSKYCRYCLRIAEFGRHAQ